MHSLHDTPRSSVRFAVLLALASAALAGAQSSVLMYGAAPDGIMRTDGAMVRGSAVLTSASSQFSAADAGKYIQVIGAGPGGSSGSGGAMASGSAVLNSSSGGFNSSDVGRGIVVDGAGPGGSNLVASVDSYSSPGSVTLSAAASFPVNGAAYFYGAMTLEGTIQSVQNSTTITLSTPALATISEATFAYGTDNHAAFQAALDAVGRSGGAVVTVPAPASCPSGATCGYVIETTDQVTATAPGGVKIRYSNLSLEGDSSRPNLFCRGAWKNYTNSAAFGGKTAEIRGNCLAIGDNGGPNGSAGESVSNVTISNLHLYGMTNGNTYHSDSNQTGPPLTTTGDGWDETHKGIFLWNNSAFSNIVIDSVTIQDFKGENIFSGGSIISGMIIRNCTLKNFNGDGISMLAANLQVLNNTITNGSNAAIENSTVGTGGAALERQLFQGNTFSYFSKSGLVVAGVDGKVPSGSIQIVNNTFDTIGKIHRSGAQSAIYISTLGSSVPPANVIISGNTCHNCYSFSLPEASSNGSIGKFAAAGSAPSGSPAPAAASIAVNGIAVTGGTGQSAAASTTPHTPTAANISTNAGTPQSSNVSTAFTTALQVIVRDSSGAPVDGVTINFAAPGSGAGASFGSGPSATAITNTNGIATAPTLTANSQSGSYVVMASLAGIGSPAEFHLTNNAVTSGGSLRGFGNSVDMALDLTGEGSLDWVHWGEAAINRKANVTPQISSGVQTGNATVQTYTNDPRPVGWRDGAPLASSAANRNGIFTSGVGQGFAVTAPAGTALHTLIVHIGGWYSGGTLKAHLSDGSAEDYVDMRQPAEGQFDRNYTLTYSAASDGQTLTVTWIQTSGAGNVTLNAAALR